MAQKRMFSRQITESDDFLDLPLPAQCLYFHLSLSADDEGFISSCRRTVRAIGASDSDLEALVDKGFLIFFPESNVYVDKAFCLNNSLRSDRRHPTTYQAERKRLTLTENRIYQFISEAASQLPTNCQPDDTREEISPDKIRREEKRTGHVSSGKGGPGEGDRNDLLLYMAGQDGIRNELEPILNRQGLDAAYKAYTKWKAAGGFVGHYRDYVDS